MPMFGNIAEALLQPKRFRWCTGIVLQPYLPWTFPGNTLHNLQLMPGDDLHCNTPLASAGRLHSAW